MSTLTFGPWPVEPWTASVRLEFPCAIIPSLFPMLINKTENVKETLCRRRIFKTDVKTLLELKKMTCPYVSLQKIAFSSELFKKFCMICMKMFDLFSFFGLVKKPSWTQNKWNKLLNLSRISCCLTCEWVWCISNSSTYHSTRELFKCSPFYYKEFKMGILRF